MNATFFCENTLCMANENEMCTKNLNPLKCSFRNDYVNRYSYNCEGCPETTECDECEFYPEDGE
jgi:hypothetical protein